MPYRCSWCNEVFETVEDLIRIKGNLYFTSDRRLIHSLDEVDEADLQQEQQQQQESKDIFKELLAVPVQAEPASRPARSFRKNAPRWR